MANPAIKKYLSQSVHNYAEGRVLFERYSDDAALKIIFRTGSSNYHHRRLLEELTKLSDLNAPEPTAPSSTLVPKPAVADLATFDVPQRQVKGEDFSTLPEQVQQLHKKKNMHHRRAMQLFIEIGFTEDQERRLEMALALLDDHQAVNQYWSLIDEYRETGRYVEQYTATIEEKVAGTDPKFIGKSIANLQSNISKDRKKINALADGHKRAKVQKRLELRLKELAEFKKLLEAGDE